ncbi:hypothetical protein EG329_005300 [Mollisiaceae sp. DMI_Dod_QoI]|nr:hypothetical protein EG329_005300 [Helotiales sp. DMI_Dod_QoI]
MERTAIAGMRRCLRSGRGLRCATQSTTVKCVAASICPARSIAKTAGISSSTANTNAQVKNSTSTSLRTRLTDNSLSSLRRDYSTSPVSQESATSASAPESSPQGTIGKGEAGIPLEAVRAQEALVAPSHLDAAESEIWELLNRELKPERLEVKDVSGGCGSMYAIEVKSERFRGLGMLKQQRLVNEVLGERVKQWHGVQMKTGIP